MPAWGDHGMLAPSLVGKPARLTMLPACVLVCGACCAVARWHEDWTYGTAIHPNFMRGYANLVVLDVARIGLALVVAMLYPVVGECAGRGQCAGKEEEQEGKEDGLPQVRAQHYKWYPSTRILLLIHR